MTAVVVTLVVASRLIVPLFIPKFPLPAIVLALVIDAADQTIFQAVTDDPLDGYQSYDKALDIYYLTIAYCSTMRNWRDPVAFGVARFLFLYRLVGVVLFETTHQRWLLLVFPNTFEYFFIAYEAVATLWNPRRLRAPAVVSMALFIWIFVKLPQETWIHILKLDVTDFVSDHPWVVYVVGAVAIGLVVVMIPVVRRLPPADHPFTVAAAARLPELPAVYRRPSLRDPVLWEKAILLALVCVIFANILPGIEAGALGIAIGATAVVLLNALVSELLYSRGRTWQNLTRAFVAMLVINLVILLVDSLVGPERDDVPTAANLGFVVLLSLLIAMFDRMRATRGPSDQRLPAREAFEQWRATRRQRQQPELPAPPAA